MARRLITALLGASLALVLGATGAMASADLTTPEELAAAKSKLLRQRLLDLTAKAGAAAVEEENPPPAEGEEPPPPPECLGEDAPEIKALEDELFEDAIEIEANDEQLNELNVAFLEAQDKFIADLESAETAAQVNAAYRTFVKAIETYFDGYLARMIELKPAFAEVSADFIAALEEAGACDDLIADAEAGLNGGQFFIDFTKFFLDEGRKAALEAAAQLRDQALEALTPPPGGQPPTGGGPIETPGRGGAELPQTGTNATAFLLLAGLALVSGGTTAIIAARRRRASA